ncbi:Fluoroacetyl-CoA thioesterase [bacterium HR25]|nr:Fluoroacetyl-CoA thioesterase [bacterium HR25]
MREIPAELAGERSFVTTPEMGTKHLGDISVYSSPAMVAQFEDLCTGMLAPYLDPGEGSVGYRLELRHLAPTLIGQRVTLRARVREAEGRRFLFELEAYNDSGTKIGEGLHERRVVDLGRFADRLARGEGG